MEINNIFTFNPFFTFLYALMIAGIVLVLITTIICQLKNKPNASIPLIKVTPGGRIRASAGDTIEFKIQMKQKPGSLFANESGLVKGVAILSNGEYYFDKFYERNSKPSIFHPKVEDTAKYVVPQYPAGTKIFITFSLENGIVENYQYAHPVVIIE